MGIIIKFPVAHVRAPVRASVFSKTVKAAKASKVISSLPISAANRTNAGQRRDGMPRVRQVLTVLFGTPSAAATAPVPPSASIAKSGVRGDIAGSIVRALRTCQGFTKHEATFSVKAGAIPDMRGFFADQKRRLEAVRIACGFDTQAAWTKEMRLSKGHWSDFEKGKRPLTLEVARQIKARWGLPLDFLLDGDVNALDQAPSGLVKKLESHAA
jgi:transcriptional regulator with XRE-family HTH domain